MSFCYSCNKCFSCLELLCPVYLVLLNPSRNQGIYKETVTAGADSDLDEGSTELVLFWTKITSENIILIPDDIKTTCI